MFNKLLIALIIFLIYSPIAVFAKTITPSDSGITRKPTAQKRFEVKREIKERVEEKKASIEARLNEKQKAIATRILNHGKKMIERSNFVLSRLDNVWQRVQRRMEKMKAKGLDLSTTDPLIEEVNQKKQEAQQAMTSAQTKLSELEGSVNIKQAVTAFQENFKSVKEAIKAYHQAIINVIQALKNISQNASPTQVEAILEE